MQSQLINEVQAPPDRDQFLASLQDAKARAAVESLGDHPYDYAQLFPKTSGWGARGDILRRVKWLRGVEHRLDLLLYPDERIEFVSKGMLNSWVEQYFLGWMSQIINQTLFLFTNYRVILLNSNGKGRPKQMMWQIPYDKIRKFKGGGLFNSSTRFRLTDGKIYKFAGIRGADRKLLSDYVNRHVQRVGAEGPEFPSHAARDPLCPACCTPLPRGPRLCDECQEPFISPMKPALLSLLLPCLGEFYLGHWVMGMFELVGYALMWLIFYVRLLDEGVQVLPVVLIFVALAHIVDAALTYHVASKGVLLARTAWRSH